MELMGKCQEISKDIYKVLGNEQEELTYNNAFEVSFILDKYRYEREKDLPIYYRNHIVGRGSIDFVVYDNITLAIEVKAVASWGTPALPPPGDISQLTNYMRSLDTCHGLLINFPQAGTSNKKQAVSEPEFFIKVSEASTTTRDTDSPRN